MTKRALLLMVIAVGLCVALAMAPFGAMAAFNKIKTQKAKAIEADDIDARVAGMQNDLRKAAKSFDDIRSFDVHYSDIENLTKVFDGVSGIEVQTITELKPNEGFRELGEWSGSTGTAAVRYDLLVSDIDDALTVLERMQLPMYSLTVNSLNQISFTFLTGGDV